MQRIKKRGGERLNERQTWFCYAVAQGIPPEEARKKAGYRKKGFEKQLMQDQKIQHAIAQYRPSGDTVYDFAAPQEAELCAGGGYVSCASIFLE